MAAARRYCAAEEASVPAAVADVLAAALMITVRHIGRIVALDSRLE
jgi:hypothetical protein